MPQKKVAIRTQKTISYSAGARVSEKLGLGPLYRDILVELSGSITSATTGSNKADIERGDEWSLIQRIDLIVNGDQTIRTFTGEELQWFNYFFYGPRRLSTALGNNSDSTSAKAFKSSLILPVRLPGSIMPLDTAIPSHLLSDMRIEITWASALTVMDGGGGTLSVSNVQAVISSIESLGDEGPFHGARIFRADQLTSLSSGQEPQIRLPVGNLYRGFLLHAFTSAGVDVDGVSNVVLRSGMDRIIDVKTEVLRDANHLLRKNKRPTTINLAAASDVVEERPFISPDSKIDGWVWLDLLDDRLLTELPDTFGWSDLELVPTIDATIGTLDILAVEVVPIRQRA